MSEASFTTAPDESWAEDQDGGVTHDRMYAHDVADHRPQSLGANLATAAGVSGSQHNYLEQRDSSYSLAWDGGRAL
jgi:hypothetical protein